jgi:hypothetical protein
MALEVCQQQLEGNMRRKGTAAAQKDQALTKRYGKIGISAVAAAARYTRSENGEKPGAARSKSRAGRGSFRGTSPKR